MNIIDILEKKKQGNTHTEDEIRFLVESMTSGETPDYQIAAWLMATCIHGLTLDETTWLTKYFVASGTQLDLSGIDGTVVDKHSTGGVGDKTTLVLLPLLAANGLKIVKLSGRGLGFTGGTIDKLESIPEFHVALSNQDMIRQAQEIGMAISCQTPDLAPADGRMYAIRDVTATVDSIPLIAASVVSKKIAAGAPIIVLDIKAGPGAFMKSVDEARVLAETCRTVGERLGKTMLTVISSMDQPLGYAVGNSIEIVETIQTLKGEGPTDVEELCLTLGAVTLIGAGQYKDLDSAKAVLKTSLTDGSALTKFRQLIQAQGGDTDILEEPHLLPQPDRITIFPSPQSGYIASINPLKIAQAAKVVGAGRIAKESPIHLGAGVLLHKKVGDTIEKGEQLVELFVGDKGHHEAMEILHDAFTFSAAPVTAPPLIHDIVSGPVPART